MIIASLGRVTDEIGVLASCHGGRFHDGATDTCQNFQPKVSITTNHTWRWVRKKAIVQESHRI